jgi:hypothetical protein
MSLGTAKTGQIDANCRHLHGGRSPRSEGYFDTFTVAYRNGIAWVVHPVTLDASFRSTYFDT